MSENNNKTEALLSIKDLIVEYTSNRQIIHAVNGVSLELKKGETLGLVGETGAGKTTIAKAILKILPDLPAKIRNGEIWFEGENLMCKTNNEMRKIRGEKISMIFQDPMTALNPTMRVGEQLIDVIREHKKMSKSEAAHEAVKMLEMVGISGDRLREYPHQFSGGMKQRVVIALALAGDPDLLLADEPTTALDVTIQAQVLDMIRKLKDEKNTSMLLITHDLGVVAETCDDVAVIYAGEIVEYGSLEEIFIHTAHPYTKGLFDSLPTLKNIGTKYLKPIAGQPPDPAELPGGCKFGPRCPYVTDKCTDGPIEFADLGGTHKCRCCNIEAIKAGKEAQ